jgi:metal-responsive CopG/Arc/MetJ family transcriptional regulator
MSKEHLSKIDQIAKATGLKKSDITRMAIRKFIAEYSDDNEAKPYIKARRLLGVIESGISDLGQNHRKYMIERIKPSRT